jgi:hypothetical protein
MILKIRPEDTTFNEFFDSFNDIEEDEVVRFGDDAPGDRIHLFHEERQKFFSSMSDGAPGSLFILPRCSFDFLEEVT